VRTLAGNEDELLLLELEELDELDDELLELELLLELDDDELLLEA
jgi:hypothetical protein